MRLEISLRFVTQIGRFGCFYSLSLHPEHAPRVDGVEGTFGRQNNHFFTSVRSAYPLHLHLPTLRWIPCKPYKVAEATKGARPLCLADHYPIVVSKSGATSDLDSDPYGEVPHFDGWILQLCGTWTGRLHGLPGRMQQDNIQACTHIHPLVAHSEFAPD